MSEVEMIICDSCGKKEPVATAEDWWSTVIMDQEIDLCDECSKKGAEVSASN